MADENPTGQYKIPGQGSEAEYGKSTVSGSTENVRSILSNKRVLSLIGVIVLVVVVWYFSSDGTDEVADEKPAPVTITKPVDEPKPVVEPKVEPVATPEPVQAAVQVPDMSGEVDQLSSRLNNYDTQMVDVTNSLQQLDSQLQDLTNKIDLLSEAVTKLTPKKKVEKKPQGPLKMFFLRAIIDGRAWIRQGISDNMTVKVGDSVDTYGKVTGIYPEEGMVTTSSGRNIVFLASE